MSPSNPDWTRPESEHGAWAIGRGYQGPLDNFHLLSFQAECWQTAPLDARIRRVNESQEEYNGLDAGFVDLWSAATAEDLHYVLVMHQPFASSADWLVPMVLLARHHKTEPNTSTTTAALLLTDRRWRNGVHRLVERIAESGLIDAADLDMLATTFVTAGQDIYWKVPESWFGDESIEIVLEDGVIDVHEVSSDTDEFDDGPMVIARRVHPPVRRWAAAHVLARDPSVWVKLLADARDRKGDDGAAIMRGLLDELDRVPITASKMIIDTAVTWPRFGVRKQALERLAEGGDRKTAHDLALRDSNAKIRELAPSLLESSAANESGGGATEPAASKAQESLF